MALERFAHMLFLSFPRMEAFHVTANGNYSVQEVSFKVTQQRRCAGPRILSEYVKVCDVTDVPPGTMHPVDVGKNKLMIVNVDGALYALNRICTHETADLSTGFLVGSVVTCPLHLSRFDVKSGAVENLPATVPLATYRLKVEGTSVYVQV